MTHESHAEIWTVFHVGNHKIQFSQMHICTVCSIVERNALWYSCKTINNTILHRRHWLIVELADNLSLGNRPF